MEKKKPLSLKWATGIRELGHTWKVAIQRILEKMGNSSAPTPQLAFYSTERGIDRKGNMK